MSKYLLLLIYLFVNTTNVYAAYLDIKKDSPNLISNIIIFYGDVKDGVSRVVEKYLRNDESSVNTRESDNDDSKNYAFMRIIWTENSQSSDGNIEKIRYEAKIPSPASMTDGKIIIKSGGKFAINFDEKGIHKKTKSHKAPKK